MGFVFWVFTFEQFPSLNQMYALPGTHACSLHSLYDTFMLSGCYLETALIIAFPCFGSQLVCAEAKKMNVLCLCMNGFCQCFRFRRFNLIQFHDEVTRIPAEEIAVTHIDVFMRIVDVSLVQFVTWK